VYPRVSVIIPCFNYGLFLTNAIQSALLQTLPNFEVIVVNDGSTDNSLEVAQGFESDARVKVVDQPNSGTPAISRNRGALHAQGDYFVFLDADDILEPDALREWSTFLNQHPEISLVYSDRFDLHSDGSKHYIHFLDWNTERLKIPLNLFSYCNMMRRSLWEAIGGFRTNVHGVEDWDAWVAMVSRGLVGYRIPKPLFTYRVKEVGVFQDVVRNEELKKALVIVNNAELFSEEGIKAAKNVIPRNVVQPLVSIIITTFNRPELVKRAICSALTQTYRNIEVIVVNDAGCDISPLIESINRSNLKYITHETNIGILSVTRNSGIAQAKGKYIGFLDDDDFLYPHHVEFLVEALEADSSLGAAYSDGIFSEVDFVNNIPVIRNQFRTQHIDWRSNIFFENNISPVTAFLVRREVLDEVGLFDPRLGINEDWELWIRIEKNFPFKRVPRTTFEVVIPVESWNSPTRKLVREKFLLGAAQIFREEHGKDLEYVLKMYGM